MSDKKILPIENPNLGELFSANGLSEIISGICDAARKHVPDVSTKTSRAKIASNAMAVAKSKTYLDRLGKDYVSVLKRQSAGVDAERRRMRANLDSLRDEVRAPLTAYEQEQAKKQAKKHAVFEEIRQAGLSISQTGSDATTDHVQAFALRLDSVDVSFLSEDDSAAAGSLIDAARYRLLGLQDSIIKREQAEQEQERQRKEAADKARKEREERIAREAADKARAEAKANAERELKAARELEENARKAEAKMKRELDLARQAEANRKARMEAEKKAKAEAKEKRQREAAKLTEEIAKDLANKANLSHSNARACARLIADNQICHVLTTFT